MKKRKMIMRRIIAVLLAMVMLGSAVDMSGVTVHAEETVVENGFCGAEGDGTNLTWQVTENGETYTLTISGTGAMKDYEDMFADDIPGGVHRDRITTIVIENGVTSIGDYAFAECTSLASVTIPSSVTSIGNDAFFACESLTDINIPSSVTSIGNGAFVACESLTDINIPSSVTSIGSAFRRCSSLTSIVLPEGITSISEYMFAYCTSLASVTIPSNVTSIGDGAFDHCTSLTSAVLPEGVESIGDFAFVSCTSLETINFLSTTTSIGMNAFDNCTSLTSVALPEDVTSVGARAFNNCTALKNVSIPSSLTSIPDGMFSGCTSLANITIPKGVTSIGDNAFMGCKALTSVIIPEAVTSIGLYSFANNDLLAEITIPSSVENIGYDAFARCPNLQTVNVPCNWDTGSPLYTFPENTTVNICDGASSHYTASGATITKKCSACGFAKGILTLESPSGLTYDGNEKQATITGSINGVENPIITYNTTDGMAPIYPGNYTASITLGNATASVSYEIAKKTITVSVAETISREYDGTNKVRIYSCECEGVLVPDSGGALIDCDGLWGTIASANVGTYYEVTMPQNLTIGPENRGYYIIEQPTGPVWTEVTITKAAAPVIETVNREYVYLKENRDTVDIGALLPEDCGTVSYNVETSGSIAYTESLGVSDGVLEFALSAGQVDDENIVTVTATTQNYEDITVIVKLKLIEKYPVALKADTEVTLQKDTLVYGDSLSDLTFNSAVFVDEAGNPVAGSLAWKTPDAVLDAGTTSADWIFTPADEEYASAEGAVAIIVNKAVPNVVTAPTVTERVYNPSVALRDTDLNADGRVVDAEGSEIAGVWKWVTPCVPVAGSNSYEAEFTPEDAGNYEKVVRTVTVNVAKATPVITVLPTGSAITYGDMLCSSVLTGTAAYVADGPIVEGSFSWKNGTVKPAVADSNRTTYEVIFTPQDTANYNQVETIATLTVNKAENAPGMPGTAMSVSNSYTKVGEVPLVTDWQWQDADKETKLEAETPVVATAVYVAADKDNYEIVSVAVTITRAACDHVVGNVLYTGAGEKAPTCNESGLGHKECTKCGTVVESGIVISAAGHSGELRHFEEPTCTTEGYTGDTYCSECGSWLSGGVKISLTGHNYVGVVTRKATTEREGIRTYTCSKCGGSYTESIAKLVADTTTEKPADKNDEKWEMVREELGVSNEGATVTVDMADTTVVPGIVFDDMKGKDLTITFVMENGVTWSINGKDITSEKVKDIDFGVKVGADANHTIPVEVINNVSGERFYINISLTYEGEFGFKAVLTLNVDAKNAGLFANLFYFNEQTNALEFICADGIAEDGTAELIFTHASEYTLVIDTEEMSGVLDSSDVSDNTEPDTEVNVEPEVEAEPENGGSALWIILLAILAAVIGAVVAWKRRKN